MNVTISTEFSQPSQKMATLDLSELLMFADGVTFTDNESARQEKGLSEDLIKLKRSLFGIPGVTQIIFLSKSISLFRAADADWTTILPQAEQFIREYPF